MYIIVGLGNPGNEYRQTRHNTGFLVVDEIAAFMKATFNPGKGDYWLAKCSLNNLEVVLLKPTTHMNSSGIAVKDFQEKYDIPAENILVVCDDFQLPLGTIRLRQNGTDGGHNGLSSVIYHLQTDRVARLRCGIGSSASSEKSDMRDFVLEEFKESEIQSLKAMIERARNACISCIVEGIDRAMNKFNVSIQEKIQ